MRKNSLSVVALAIAVTMIAGCNSGCGVLDKGTADKPSPYGGVTPAGELKTPDRILYDADFAISTAYDGIHGFVSWEYNNRAALAGTPEIKKAADRIRAGAKGWFQSAVSVRDAYAKDPTAQNRSALAKALDVLQQAIAEGNRYRMAELPSQ